MAILVPANRMMGWVEVGKSLLPWQWKRFLRRQWRAWKNDFGRFCGNNRGPEGEGRWGAIHARSSCRQSNYLGLSVVILKKDWAFLKDVSSTMQRFCGLERLEWIVVGCKGASGPPVDELALEKWETLCVLDVDESAEPGWEARLGLVHTTQPFFAVVSSETFGNGGTNRFGGRALMGSEYPKMDDPILEKIASTLNLFIRNSSQEFSWDVGKREDLESWVGGQWPRKKESSPLDGLEGARVVASFSSEGDGKGCSRGIPTPEMISRDLGCKKSLRCVDRGILGKSVIASMASFPEREANLQRVVKDILPQVDGLRVYLNDYTTVPSGLDHPKITVFRSQECSGDLRDNGKFYRAGELEECIHLTLDDDLWYPESYVGYLIAKLFQYGGMAVVGVHGNILKDPLRSFQDPRSRKCFHLESALLEDSRVHLLGTGTIAYYTGSLSVDERGWGRRGMVDLCFGTTAYERGIPRVVVSRREKWLREQVDVAGGNLFSEAKKNEESILAWLAESEIMKEDLSYGSRSRWR